MNIMMTAEGGHFSVRAQTYYDFRITCCRASPHKFVDEYKTEKDTYLVGVIILIVICCIRVLCYKGKCCWRSM